MKYTHIISLILGSILLLVTLASAQVPQMINYQGRVAVGDPAVNFNGTGLFKFALVNEDGSTSYWSNDDTSREGSEPTAAVSLTVSKGLYSVLLGANMTAIPSSVFANSDVHLRVWFNDGTNGSQLLTPDQRIAAVGYAMVASTVVDGAITSEKLASGLALEGTTSGTFSGDGSGLKGIPASAIVSAPPAGMVLIPDGAFTMGDSVDGLADADPVSTTVSAFYMDVTEVTLSQWQVVQQWATLVGGYTALTVGSGKGQEHPVHTVNWYDCVKWCNARSEREGKTPVYYTDDAQTLVYKTGDVDVTNAQVKWSANGYRLPTEAEWEKAAHGGLSGKRFPWGDTISQKQANYNSGGFFDYDDGPDGYNPIGTVGGTEPATSPVGTFAANGYGLYDMAGNVCEWCWDWYGTFYAGGTDPHGAATGSNRVIRGGSWFNFADITRCAIRLGFTPGFADNYFGFRAVLAPGQP